MAKKQLPLPRAAGILMGIPSLPSPYGIGTLGAPASVFMDVLCEAGQRYWQVLPIGHTGFGFSPYQCFSAFAGNPYLIDPADLYERGLLTDDELAAAVYNGPTDTVAYDFLEQTRLPLLARAFSRRTPTMEAACRRFTEQKADWLPDYALFMALKEHFDGRPWSEWPRDIALRQADALARYRDKLADRTAFYAFVQYLFFDQWARLKAEAASRGIAIIGDVPIYVAMDSADAWAHRDQFLFDEQGGPLGVAGVPPDYFSKTGQLWGNPLYDWAAMKQDGFSWWRARMRESAALYDMIRIDHFIGLVHYYVIPPDAADATGGEYRDGPADEWVAAVLPELAGKRLIAEDLGNVTPQVERVMKRAGLPGMRVLQFGFDGCSADNPHLPHRYERNQLAYTGTHDNPPIGDIADRLSRKAARFARRYLGIRKNAHLPQAMIRALYASVAGIAVVQMQDVLNLGEAQRTNTPGTVGGNWRWRLSSIEQVTPHVAWLSELAGQYERL